MILQCIKGYKITFDKKPTQINTPIPVFKTEENLILDREIIKLVEKGAIVKCHPAEEQFISSYFLVPKKDGSSRFVLNLKKLNKFITTSHFQMEDLRTAIKLVSPGIYMTSIDLKDAFFLVPVDKSSRKYLRFIFNGQVYEFTCLPFGLCLCPYLFTRIMKAVIGILRRKGYISSIYLDDFLVFGKNEIECLRNTTSTIKLLEKLGFIINAAKSSLEPSTRCKYLGFILDSSKMTVELPQEKREKLKKLVLDLYLKKQCLIRVFAKLIGSLVASCPGLEYAKAHIKNFEMALSEALIGTQGNFDKKMVIPSSLKIEFDWWLERLSYSTRKIRDTGFDIEIFTDASSSGWGAACCNETARGFWNEHEKSLHINHLELLAAWYGIKCFARDFTNKQILLRIDNTTALSYINNMGGTHVARLNSLAQEIWDWCESRDLWLYASYIPSRENVDADRESRIRNDTTEWQLSDSAFSIISKAFGPFDIDLFASRINAKCEVYCSWHRDPEATYIDAFTFSWSSMLFYAFPPFSMILKTLRKIILEKATGVVVVPLWNSQAWFPIFSSLLIEEPIYFKPSTKLLSLPFSPQNHPMSEKLTLVAGRLSGRLIAREEFPNHLSKTLYRQFRIRQSNNTTHL